MRMKVFARVVCAVGVIGIVGALSSVLVTKLRAQQIAGRIAGEIDNSARTVLAGSRPPLTRRATDKGTVAPEMQLQGMSLVFSRTAAQSAAIDALIAEQQNPASPLYHRWLTPDEFGARFGMSDTDLAKVESWLQEQGFTIDGVSRGRDRVRFSGTAAQVNAAFGTELHYYAINGENHFAPSTDLSIPTALASVVQGVSNLSTFRPKPRFSRPKSRFTSSQTGNHFLSPADVATIYDIKTAYNAGFNGKGQSIAVVGQSSVDVTDVENFQNAAGLQIKDPTLVFFPGSGHVAESQGDESESDLDLEYSGGIAPGAAIYFVYVGDNQNFSVFDSIQYAVDNNVAPIISDSYGVCETAVTAAEYSSVNQVLQQGAAQGQSIITPSGDSGSPDCEGVPRLTTSQQQALAVDFPASSQYVTAMGGTEFPSADVIASNTQYWQSASGTDVISSALSYIPEQVWNDDAPPSGSNPANLSAGGGGISTLTARPSWQTGVPGIPTGTMRLVPDISLSGSPDNAGYLYCSSDASIGVTGSCSHGFRDVNTTNLTVAGGTSFDSPIFAGLVAIINQKVQPVTNGFVGQGVVSSTLYQLASNSTTYASAFHDIQNGNNNCSQAGSTVCSGSSMTQYSSTPGYDMASGLGSIDFNHLLSAWPPGSTKTASRTTVSAATNAPATGTSDAITIDVAPGSGSTTPTGTVNVLVDGAAASGSPFTLTSGSAGFSFVPSAGGSHVINATYSGDLTFAPSVATLVVGNQTFRLTATSPTIASGTSGTATMTITPQQGYTGSVAWTVTSSPTLTNGCFSLPNATVSGTAPVTATLTINTSATACGGSVGLISNADRALWASGGRPISPVRGAPLGLAIAGLLLAGVFASPSAKRRGIVGMLLLCALTLSLPACGGGSSSSTLPPTNKKVAPGNYTLTVVGTDTTSSSISGSVAVSLTVN